MPAARHFLIPALLAGIIALPLALRQETHTASPSSADDTLVILTPHTESIQQEFGEAFAAHWKATTGRTVYLDWRSPGGMSEIRMVIDAGYKAAAETGRDGMGADLLFGGGEPDFADQARKGHLAPLQVFDRHPEWFGPDGPIRETFSGERFFPPDRVWVGTCLAQFGICHNPDAIKRLGISAPVTWDDLGDPQLCGHIALSDPSKSGSVARSFELVVQSKMKQTIETKDSNKDIALATGWEEGLRLVQRMAANARYFTDSGSRIPQEVAQGNAAAGMSIDLYGRSFQADLRTRDGRPRVVWHAPPGGTTLSADPIGVLRGAPHPELAQAFAAFCLSPAGQVLWFAKVGTPGGPRHRALHRLPIRSDVYTPENLARATDSGLDPYRTGELLAYDRELTGRAFNTLRRIVRVMCIDPHDEMKSAWAAIIRAGMPADALAVFQDVSPLPYAEVGHGDPLLDHPDPLVAEKRATDLANRFRENYRRAEAMARQNTVRDKRP